MKFLVTGGAGFIGSHVVDALVARGDEVVVIDNLSSGTRDYLPANAIFHHGNVEQPDAWPDASGVDVIVHLAARPSVGESWTNILEAHHDNLSATLCVIRMAMQYAVPRIVTASSAAVYGSIEQLPISEAGAGDPMSPYGFQKLASEAYLKLFAYRGAYSGVNLRFFNVYGERQSATSEYSGVIAKFIAAARNGQPATIYGTGSQTRDFVHVSDIVRAILAASAASVNPGSVLSVNVGTGQQTSLLELLQCLREVTGACLPPNFAAPRAGDIGQSVADTSAAEKLIGFKAQTVLSEGLQKYLRWLEPQEGRSS